MVKYSLDTFANRDIVAKKKRSEEGGRPGLVVMGGDSCSKGSEFESRHRILNGHFFTFTC